MVAVGVPIVPLGTVTEGSLSASAIHVVHPHATLAAAIVRLVLCLYGRPTIQLSARDGNFRHAPSVVANGSPGPLVEDFHSARAATRPVLQPDGFAVCGEKKKNKINDIQPIF